MSRGAGVMTRRQAADLEASLSRSHPLQAMPTTHAATAIQSSPNPARISEARFSANWKSWEAAIQVELLAMNELGVWTLMYLPPGGRKIKLKWLFLEKMNPDGTLNKYRAHLVPC